MINLLYITLIVVFITDISGVIDHIKSALSKWLKCRVPSLKPFDCSLCMTWWVCLLYVLIAEPITFSNVTLCALCAIFADKVGDTISLVRDIITKTINKLYQLLGL